MASPHSLTTMGENFSSHRASYFRVLTPLAVEVYFSNAFRVYVTESVCFDVNGLPLMQTKIFNGSFLVQLMDFQISFPVIGLITAMAHELPKLVTVFHARDSPLSCIDKPVVSSLMVPLRIFCPGWFLSHEL